MPGEDTVLRLVNGVPTTGTIEDNTYTYTIDASSVSVGDVVYQVSGVDSKVARADADNASARPPIGVCLSVPTATTAVVVHSGGVVTGLTGLTRGSTYWLSTTAGAMTSTRPGTNAYVVGVAVSSSILVVCCVPADLAGASGTITIKDDGQTINTNFTSLNFTGFATITDAGGGAATINVQGGGGTGGPSASGAINTVPTASQFPTTVLGAGSVTDTTSALVLKSNAHGATYNVQQILQTAPASPWIRYFKMEVNPLQKQFLFGGFAIKQTSSGKFAQWVLISGGSDLNLEYDQMTNATTRSSFTAVGVIDPTDVYFAIEDDGANFNFYSSPTGIVGTYVLAHSVSRTAWMTDYDLIGFCVDAQNASAPNRDAYAVIEHYSADPPTFVAGTNTAFSTMWNPKALPASPNAKDDEFSDGSVDAKWTEFDPPGVLTVTEDAYGLKLVAVDDPGVGGLSLVGVYQAIPSDDEFEIITKVTLSGPVTSYLAGGIFVSGNIAGSPSSAPWLLLGFQISANGFDEVWVLNETNRTSFSSKPYGIENRSDTMYLALQWKTSTNRYCAWFSYTGVDWTRLSAETATPGTVSTASYMGFVVDANPTTVHLRSEFFRLRSASSGILNSNPSSVGARVAVSNGARTGSGTDNQLVRWDGTQNLQGSSISVDDSGNLTLAAAAAIKITEAASPPSTSAGVGALWVKNTTPSSFRVVDDAGTDTPLLIGPASSTNNSIMLWNGASGTTAKDSNVTINGNNIIVGAEGVTMAERGTSPSVSAGQGSFWVRNDTPSAPVYTDDTSTAYHLLNWSPVKRPCRFATTANIANLATGAPNTADGVTPVVGNRVLVWNQSTASQNGIYCADEETDILTPQGFAHHTELRTGDQVLTLNLETGKAEWQAVEAIHVFPSATRELLSLEVDGVAHSSLTTLNHRWPVKKDLTQDDRHQEGGVRTKTAQSVKTGEKIVIKTSAELNSNDSLIRAAELGHYPTHSTYGDLLVELIAWFYTEGHIRMNNSGTPSNCVRIAQSARVNASSVNSIERCLTGIFGSPSAMLRGAGHKTPKWRKQRANKNGIVLFELNSAAGAMLIEIAPNRVPSFDFLKQLTREQLELFIATSIAADGHVSKTGQTTFVQKNKARRDAFVFACHMFGQAVSVTDTPRRDGCYTVTLVRRYTIPALKAQKRVEHTGVVWCPEVRNGTWFARRRSTYYFTGNTVNVVGTGANGQWARAADFDEGPNDHIEAGVETYVQDGTAWGGIRFTLATTGTITIGSTSLTFTPEGGLARTDATSTEVIAATAFTSGTFVTSSTIDMRDHSVLAVFFLATSLGSNTQVDIVLFWSDDGTTIPFATDDNLQMTDFNLTDQLDGSYYPKAYTARLTTTGGELVANAGVHLSFPKRGGACRIGVKGNNASGSFSVRAQRVTT